MREGGRTAECFSTAGTTPEVRAWLPSTDMNGYSLLRYSSSFYQRIL